MILITGAAGYIGSHIALELLKQNREIVIFDNLSTGHIETIETLKNYGNFEFINGDLKKISDIKFVFENFKIDAVIHFAASSQVSESVINPKKYYENNVIGSINLLNVMVEKNIKKIVFSSTAAVYGEPEYTPIDENHKKEPVNPYGKTKLIIENIMDDYDLAYNLKSIRLRYFNVAGANKQSIIGENHNPETHLIPNILKSTLSGGKEFEMYGTDYNTKDGTCVRDYIDIDDLVSAHLLSLDYLNKNNKTEVFNLGTKEGNTVKEVFNMCEKVTKKTIPVNMKDRRPGDPAILIADNSKAVNLLGWQAKISIKDTILSAYNWEEKLAGN